MTKSGAEEFYHRFHDRTVRYGESPLDPDVQIAISVDPEFVATRPGQAALIIVADLLCRIVRNVDLHFLDFEFDTSFGGPFQGSCHKRLLNRMQAAAPPGEFTAQSAKDDSYAFHLARQSNSWVADGSDWNFYTGPSPSPLGHMETDNIFGASLAAITAVARIFVGRLPKQLAPQIGNVLSLRSSIDDRLGQLPRGSHLGELWFIGCGSVGSAIAYFLSLAGYRFDATLFDADPVELENVSRSPIFIPADEGDKKVEAVGRFLDQFEITAERQPHWLHQSRAWIEREIGSPDLIVSAANEHDVRYQVESQFPCPQIYGTTGKNWSANVFRHIPPEPCSCCAFPPTSKQTACATGEVSSESDPDKTVDAALPFLSFAAGLLAAAEIAKLRLPGFPYSKQRGFFEPAGDTVLYSTKINHRPDCLCISRNRKIHQRSIAGSLYAEQCSF